MSNSNKVVDNEVVQLIRNKRAQLQKKRVRLRRELSIVESDIRSLQNQCGHPNGVSGTLYETPTFDCPDCGYGAIYITEDKPKPRGRKPRTNRDTIS